MKKYTGTFLLDEKQYGTLDTQIINKNVYYDEVTACCELSAKLKFKVRNTSTLIDIKEKIETNLY